MEMQLKDILADYMWNKSMIPLCILDKANHILKTNPGFNKLLGIYRLEETSHLNDYLEIVKQDVTGLHRTLYLVKQNQKYIEAKTLTDGTYQILIIEDIEGDSEALFNQMSNLNAEMSSMTRDMTKKNRKLNEANKHIQALLNTDFLTGAYNRRFFFETLQKFIDLYDYESTSKLGVISIDIDHFKYFNDTYGHEMGDEILKLFTKTIMDVIRSDDVFARVGGEEFFVIVMCKDSSYIELIAEKLRVTCEQLLYPNVERSITASFGVTILKEGDTLTSLIKRADDCLYEAKSSGRNRVVYK